MQHQFNFDNAHVIFVLGICLNTNVRDILRHGIFSGFNRNSVFYNLRHDCFSKSSRSGLIFSYGKMGGVDYKCDIMTHLISLKCTNLHLFFLGSMLPYPLTGPRLPLLNVRYRPFLVSKYPNKLVAISVVVAILIFSSNFLS